MAAMAAADLHAAMVAGLSTDIILLGMRPANPRGVSLLDGTLPLPGREDSSRTP